CGTSRGRGARLAQRERRTAADRRTTGARRARAADLGGRLPAAGRRDRGTAGGAGMSAITLSRRLPLVGWSPSAGGLGRVEAPRMLRHPAYLLGLAWLALIATNLT